MSDKKYRVHVSVSLVPGKTAEDAEISPHDLIGVFPYSTDEATSREEAERMALNWFHECVPIGNLECVTIETQVVEEPIGPPAEACSLSDSDIVTALGIVKDLFYEHLHGDSIDIEPFMEMINISDDEASRLYNVTNRYLLQESLPLYYAVTGRIHGDDEDTMLFFEATSQEEAWQMFREEMTGIDPEGAEKSKEECEQEDPVIYINSTACSRTPFL